MRRWWVWVVIGLAIIAVGMISWFTFLEWQRIPFGIALLALTALVGVISFLANLAQIDGWIQEQRARRSGRPKLIRPMPGNYVERPVEHEAILRALLQPSRRKKGKSASGNTVGVTA